MNNYESYKKTDIAWLKEIPSHWEIENISHIFEERKEKNIDQKENFILSVVKNIGVIPYTEKGNVGNKASEDTSNYKMVYPNDIVLNSMNMMIGSLGKSEYKGVLSQVYYILKLKEKDKYNINYLTYIFKNQKFYKSLRVLGKGILNHRLRVPMELLKYEKLPIPPINEQIQIANYLACKINEIDKLILIEKEKIKELNYKKQLSISYEYSKINKKRRLKTLLSEQLLYGINGVGKESGDIRFIRITDIDGLGELKNENILYLDKCDKKFLLKEGDVLFARSGATVGKTYLHKKETGNMAFAGYLIRARINKTLISPQYIYYYLQSEKYEVWKKSVFIQSTIQNISAEKYANFEIPFTNQFEQKNIIKKVKNIIEKIEKIKDILYKKITNLQALKQSLIAEVVTGKIDVRNINIPQYEKAVIVSEVNNNDRMEE